MVETPQTRDLTPADKLAMRNGECIAVGGCPDACGAYAHVKKHNGFDTCVCGHTRWAHEKKFVQTVYTEPAA